jgi:hypothetical protein
MIIHLQTVSTGLEPGGVVKRVRANTPPLPKFILKTTPIFEAHCLLYQQGLVALPLSSIAGQGLMRK